ncbi:MAG: thiamine-phosphate kinase [Rhodoferax sp.]|uniref:thiamine-phosphate kinase n=1 Tax=Rhodoferax sp. TaxID=50421 RepID=UPI001B5F3B56|nr:thiamine-phosphate kinase [Rhodoferax sp.]MBP9906889.1 thiamine-phosphate kinase [Rhodoferax sp.]
MGEFDLIKRYFQRPVRRAALGVGDDCALLQPAANTQMAISSDMLVQDRHFFADVDPYKLGHKALAVNLSDLAACGAQPRAFTLALALPHADVEWLEPFSKGLLRLADAHDCELVGGDTTRGPLNICITVMGEVTLVNGQSQALLRSGAKAGHDIYVSGNLGDARLALEALQGKLQLAEDVLTLARVRLEQPTPRVALGVALRGIASAAIDLSDGLLGDLQHVLDSSRVGATIDADVCASLIASIPYGESATHQLNAHLTVEQRRHLALSGGDDYELLFTAPVPQRQMVAKLSRQTKTRVTRIGHIEQQSGLRLLDDHGQLLPNHYRSFDHFA